MQLVSLEVLKKGDVHYISGNFLLNESSSQNLSNWLKKKVKQGEPMKML